MCFGHSCHRSTATVNCINNTFISLCHLLFHMVTCKKRTLTIKAIYSRSIFDMHEVLLHLTPPLKCLHGIKAVLHSWSNNFKMLRKKLFLSNSKGNLCHENSLIYSSIPSSASNPQFRLELTVCYLFPITMPHFKRNLNCCLTLLLATHSCD